VNLEFLMPHSGCVSGEDLWQWRQSARQSTLAALYNAHPHSEVLVKEHIQELDWLLTAVAAVDRLSLKLETYRAYPVIAVEISLPHLSVLWQRRLTEQVPVQYLLGRTDWRDFTLTVAPGVLIPRPETELLIDLALAAFSQAEPTPTHWADLGTGSGAIALALAKSFPHASLHAVDTSATALNIAKQNAKRLGLTEQVQFYQGDWLDPLIHLKGKLKGIVSNPPYIPSAIVPTLQPEIAYHEPHLALDGGADGLDAIRAIVLQAPNFLKSGGVLLLEMMMGQSEAVYRLLEQSGYYRNIQIHPDLAGIQRFAQAHRI
jgi:release factor glutamine methyltransferase